MNNQQSSSFPSFGIPERRASSPLRSVIYNAAHLTALAAITSFATGCATHYKFAVEAVNQSREALLPQSYTLVDARPDGGANDPVFARVVRDVQTALSSKGLYAAPPGASPQIVIEVDYGISAPVVTQHVRTEPMYIVAPRSPAFPVKYGDPATNSDVEARFFRNKETTFTVTRYEKFLRLTARESMPAGSAAHGRQVWSLYVSNNDRSNDLQRYARLMVAAAMDNIARELEPGRRVVLTGRDGRVIFIEKGMDTPSELTSL